MDETWPQVGNIYELGLLKNSPRLCIRHKTNVLYVNQHAFKLLGEPTTIEATINPALSQISIQAKGQYHLSRASGPKEKQNWSTNFLDGRFLPDGMYAPVPGQKHLYQYIGKFVGGSANRIKSKSDFSSTSSTSSTDSTGDE